MTTPRLTPFPATTPSAKVFAPFVIIYDPDDEITTLPVSPAPPSPDRTPALYGYLLDSGGDSSDEDLSETVESLHTQTASMLVVHPPPTRPLPTNRAFARRPGKEISMPLGYKAAIDQWRAALPSTYKVAENASNKMKWEGDHGGSSSQQQNKEHKVIRAHTAKPSNKKGYAGNLPLCNKCKFHHTGPRAAKCGNCKWVGHQTRYCRTLVPREKERSSVAK
ncbi:hypothetical protein Tco_0737894 [Tanacetum coccineum]